MGPHLLQDDAPKCNRPQDEETAMRIDLFAHFTTQEFRQAYLSIPLGAKGRRLAPLASRTFVQAQGKTDIDVLWDMEQRLRVLDRYGIDLQVLTLCFPMVGGLEPEEELRLGGPAQKGLGGGGARFSPPVS